MNKFIASPKIIILSVIVLGLAVAGGTAVRSLYRYYSDLAVTDGEKAQILAYAGPQIKSLTEAWNQKNFQKFVDNFSGELKNTYNEKGFMRARDLAGRLISAKEPSVYEIENFIKIWVPATFEKRSYAAAVMILIKKDDKQHLIDEIQMGLPEKIGDE